MKPEEREQLSKQMLDFLKKELPGKPFLVTLTVLDREATRPEEKNQTEVFIEPSAPFTQMPFTRAKVLIEAFGNSAQMLLTQTAINIQNIVPKEAKPKEKEMQYG